MTKNQYKEAYFKWLCNFIKPYRGYRKLLYHLYNTRFTYTISLDSNRFSDGIDLKYRFSNEKYPEKEECIVIEYISIPMCSILEMMIALSLRMEYSIMTDSKYGDRTAIWFWNMIDSLGLKESSDDNYNEEYVDTVLYKFLNRHYKANGKGGLFTVSKKGIDMRDMEIWYQMNAYLNELTEEGD